MAPLTSLCYPCRFARSWHRAGGAFVIKSTVPALALFLVFGATAAQAQNCTSNFTISGGLAPAISTWDSFPGLKPDIAIDNLARAAQLNSYWVSIKVNRRLGLLTALNDGARNGRVQQVKMAVRKRRNATRVDYSVLRFGGITKNRKDASDQRVIPSLGEFDSP